MSHSTSVRDIAGHRWLSTSEIYSVLSSAAAYGLMLSAEPPNSPPLSGTLLLYDKSATRRWRLDGHDWATPERHVKLKLNGESVVTANYSHSKNDNGGLHRRSYWIIKNEHIVLVHYLQPQLTMAAADADALTLTPPVSASSSHRSTTSQRSIVTSLSSSPVGSAPASCEPTINIECAPLNDDIEGGTSMMIHLSSSSRQLLQSFTPPFAMFGTTIVQMTQISGALYRCTIPPLYSAQDNESFIQTSTSIELFVTDGNTKSNTVTFEYRSNHHAHAPSRHPEAERSSSQSHLTSDTQQSSSLISFLRLLEAIGERYTQQFINRSAHQSLQPTPMIGVTLNDIISAVEQQAHDLIESIAVDYVQRIHQSSLTTSVIDPFHDSNSNANSRHNSMSDTHFRSLSNTDMTPQLHIPDDADDRSTLTMVIPEWSLYDSHGWTILHYAAALGYQQFIHHVLDTRLIDINVRDSNAQTPLSYALNPQTIDTLIGHGASTHEQSAQSNGHNNHVKDERDSLSRDSVEASERLDNGTSTPSSPPSPQTVALTGALSDLTLADMGVNTSELDSITATSNDDQFEAVVSKIQRRIRAWLFKRHYAASRLQAVARGMLVRKNVKRMRESATLIQSVVRTRRVRREFVRMKEAAVTIQQVFRRRKASMQLASANASRSGSAANTPRAGAAPSPGMAAWETSGLETPNLRHSGQFDGSYDDPPYPTAYDADLESVKHPLLMRTDSGGIIDPVDAMGPPPPHAPSHVRADSLGDINAMSIFGTPYSPAINHHSHADF